MKLVVGLGNPDEKYKNTFHNLGFMCVDRAAEILGVTFNKEKCRASVCDLKVGGEKVILAKPLTYMNLSGESVRELLAYYKIDVKDLIVVYDDYDLNKGFLRIRENGSAGTHNGMRNIISLCGSNFPRVRVGFKPEEKTQIPLLDLVLSGIKKEDEPVFNKAIDAAAKALVEFAKGETLQNIMQRYNGKPE